MARGRRSWRAFLRRLGSLWRLRPVRLLSPRTAAVDSQVAMVCFEIKMRASLANLACNHLASAAGLNRQREVSCYLIVVTG